MEFLGKAGASQDDALKWANNTTGVLNSAGGIFGTLIIDIIALVFIWMAFMAAKNVSKAVKMAVEPFEKIGQQVGSLAKSIPKYTPIPGLGMSANSLSKVPDKIQAGFETRSNEKAAESALGKLIGLDGKLSKDYAQLKVVQWKAEMSPSELNELQKNVQNIVGTKWTLSEEGKKAMEDWVEILKKNKTKISLDDSKLNASLISGGKLTQEWEQILLWKLSDSTYIKKPGEAEKLAKANPNYVPGTWWTSGASTSIITAKIELTKDGTNKITVLNEPIQFKLKDNGDIDGTITGLDKLKDKKTGMTKEAFTTILQSSWNITKNAADKIAKEAEDITGFFESK